MGAVSNLLSKNKQPKANPSKAPKESPQTNEAC